MSPLDAIRARARKLKAKAEVLRQKGEFYIFTETAAFQYATDIERLLKANDILRKELICSTNWYEAKCECCRPFGERAKLALAAADRALEGEE